MEFYAHTLSGQPPEAWQSLNSHLEEVGRLAGEFASTFGAQEWGNLAGLWHDIGKYSKEFQAYLRRDDGTDAHIENVPGRVDHSSAGAQHASQTLDILGHLLAYVIAGHHSGLLDGRSETIGQEDRLKKEIFAWTEAPADLLSRPAPPLPRFLSSAFGRKDAFTISFFVRMLYSCLVDADFLDTERFMSPDQAAFRFPLPSFILASMAKALDEYIRAKRDDSTPINAARESVRAACLAAAERPPGLFSLTVPTGGGKTLSSLAFALRHADLYGLRRVVYVLPFTTIIEQNAGEFRRAMGSVREAPADRLVIEHHCGVDTDRETASSRVACENWDAPLIITTSVQFYQSLFSRRSSACRKLHNLSQSVIILDEAQAIPVDYLEPALRALKELVSHYGSTVVLCTATQPAIHKGPGFPIGIENVREIIPDPPALYSHLKRVSVEDLGPRGDDEIVSMISEETQALCIVNTRGHARLLMQKLGRDEDAYHLSALMCPAHRAEIVASIRSRLERGLSCRVISTQLIEAGIDIDFPVVFRSMAGLDSIAQAAGRCNRNGRLSGLGRTYIFESEHQDRERFLADTAACASQVLAIHPDTPLGLDAVECYFKLYYWDQTSRWDAKRILQLFHLAQDRQFPFLFDFERAAREFRLIAEDTIPVVIPWGDEGHRLCKALRAMPGLNGDILRRLQRCSVPIRRRSWAEQIKLTIEPLFGEALALLTSPELHYSPVYGLHFDELREESFLY